jgi:nucleoside-diphosphate-sugar epimerase
MNNKKFGRYFESDLDEILEYSQENLNTLSKSKILILGGTGFVGSWLATALIYAKKMGYVDLELTIGARNIGSSSCKISLEANNLYKIVNLDFETIPTVSQSKFTHLVHSATPSSPLTGGLDAQNVQRVALNASQYLLEIAAMQTSPPVLMHLSSGAVYGELSKGQKRFSESSLPKDLTHLESAYSKIKYEIEKNVEDADTKSIVIGSNPRLFAFAGPGIALDAHFAIGNFLNNALRMQEIELKGNPLTERSYLYPTDMVSWLVACLANPTIEPTHIGSDQPLTMQEIAHSVSTQTSGVSVTSGNLSATPSYYVPETIETKKRLRVNQKVGFEESIKRWAKWLQN